MSGVQSTPETVTLPNGCVHLNKNVIKMNKMKQRALPRWHVDNTSVGNECQTRSCWQEVGERDYCHSSYLTLDS